MSADKNFQPLIIMTRDLPQKSKAHRAIVQRMPAHQEPKYTQLYGLDSDGKMPLDPQASPEFQGAEGKAEPYQHTPKQFDIDPKTHEALLIAQGIRNGLIIIPALIILVVLGSGFIIGIIYGIDSISQTIINIAIVISLPYMVHVILQVVAYMRFRKSVKFQWIRGANIYSIIVAPISEVTYVSFILGRILDPSSSAESSFTIVGVIVALYEVILGISMIVVMTNSIKKTAQLSEEIEG